MSFSVPKSWEELTQEQLRDILRLLWLYGEAPDWQQRVEMAALLYLCQIEVVQRTAEAWLCRERNGNSSFLMSTELLPSMLKHVEWVTQTDSINVRLESVGKYQAIDFELHDLKFGLYLEAENYYQSFLVSRDSARLVPIARILYDIPDEDKTDEFKEEVLTGVFLWYSNAKRVLSERFPHFLKKTEGTVESTTPKSLQESTEAQIRLLTKGDVTKRDYVINGLKTWEAFAELDAQAREAEEIRQKYGE